MKNILLVLSLSLAASLLTLTQAHAKTQITQQNILGNYIVRALDVYMVSKIILLENNKSKIDFYDSYGQVICEGSFTYSEENQILTTVFNNCEQENIKYTIDLNNKKIEELVAGTETLVSIDVNSNHAPAAQFFIQKTKF